VITATHIALALGAISVALQAASLVIAMRDRRDRSARWDEMAQTQHYSHLACLLCTNNGQGADAPMYGTFIGCSSLRRVWTVSKEE
jgi:hypothetical protein